VEGAAAADELHERLRHLLQQRPVQTPQGGPGLREGSEGSGSPDAANQNETDITFLQLDPNYFPHNDKQVNPTIRVIGRIPVGGILDESG